MSFSTTLKLEMSCNIIKKEKKNLVTMQGWLCESAKAYNTVISLF